MRRKHEEKNLDDLIGKIDRIPISHAMRAHRDLSLIAEGFANLLYAMGEEGLGLRDEDWRNFALGASPVLDAAYRKADEEFQQIEESIKNAHKFKSELRDTLRAAVARKRTRGEKASRTA